MCEGRNTEPTYFRELRRSITNALVDLEIVSAAGVPYSLAERAVELAKGTKLARRRHGGGNSYEAHDQIWAVFDRDEHPRYEEAIALCTGTKSVLPVPTHASKCG